MKKIILIALLQLPFISLTVAETLIEINVYSHHFALPDTPADLVVSLDEMTLGDAHDHLKDSSYSISDLEKAFALAHKLGKPTALINIAYQLSLLYQINGQGHHDLSHLIDTSKKTYLPDALRKKMPLEGTQSVDLNQLKKDLVESYKTNLPKETSAIVSTEMASTIVSYMEHLLKDGDFQSYTTTVEKNYHTNKGKSFLEKFFPRKKQLGFQTRQDIKNYANLFQKWDIS